MLRKIKEDQFDFARAANEFAARPGESEAITTMMRLACESPEPSVQKRASDWLLRMVGVKVIVPAVLAALMVISLSPDGDASTLTRDWDDAATTEAKTVRI